MRASPCDESISLTTPLYLIDGHYHIYRAYFGMRPLTNSEGQPVHAVFALIDLIQRLRKERQPARWAIAMDSRGPTFRHEMYDPYKANREEMPSDLRDQFTWINEALTGLRIPVLKIPGYEADDIIATLAKAADDRGETVRILSRDKDLEQILSDNVRFLDLTKDEEYGPAELEAKRGITPERVIEYQALIGDTSDNIPGVPGIGPKTATKLLDAVDDVEELLEDPIPDGIPKAALKKLRDNVEKYRISRELAKLRVDVPLEEPLDLGVVDPDPEQLRPLYLSLGFRKFLDDLPASDSDTADAAPAVPTAAPHERVRTDDDASLSAWLEKVKEAGRVTLVTFGGADPIVSPVDGVAMSLESGEAAYVDLVDEESRGARIDRLGPVLEDEEVAKRGHHLKRQLILWRGDNVAVRGVEYDSKIASYLVNPSRTAHDLAPLVGELLDEDLPDMKALRDGTLTQSEDDIAEAACAIVHASRRLGDYFATRTEALELDRVLAVEIPLIEVLAAMEREGVTLDQICLSQMEDEVSAIAKSLESQIHEAAGHPFNIKSPIQLREVLFTEQGLPTAKKTKSGFSTSAEVLEELAASHPDNPLPRLILDYRSHTKLLNTYIEALPRLVKPQTGRLHTDLRQTVAATGRLSSNDPNLQNIPIKSELGRRIRLAFVPNHEGYRYFSADYSQIELRLLAHLSQDDTLLSTLTAGEDIHTRVAATLHDKEPDDVTREERTAAKAVNFGVIYGMGAFGLAKDLGIAFGEAKRFIEAFFAGYPKVREFIDQTIEYAKEHGEVRTILGRRRQIPELRSRVPHIRSQGERFAVNTVVQGSAADLIKMAMVDVYRDLRERESPTRMLLQIHDELLFESPSEIVAEEATRIRERMEQVYELDVPLIANVSEGDNWFDASK